MENPVLNNIIETAEPEKKKRGRPKKIPEINLLAELPKMTEYKGRMPNAKSKKERYTVSIQDEFGWNKQDKKYNSLFEIAEDLGITIDQCRNIRSRNSKRMALNKPEIYMKYKIENI